MGTDLTWGRFTNCRQRCYPILITGHPPPLQDVTPEEKELWMRLRTDGWRMRCPHLTIDKESPDTPRDET